MDSSNGDLWKWLSYFHHQMIVGGPKSNLRNRKKMFFCKPRIFTFCKFCVFATFCHCFDHICCFFDDFSISFCCFWRFFDYPFFHQKSIVDFPQKIGYSKNHQKTKILIKIMKKTLKTIWFCCFSSLFFHFVKIIYKSVLKNPFLDIS